MKRNFLYTLSALAIVTIVVISCSKDRGPRLIVNVIEEDGTPAPGASVHAWYGPSAGQAGSVLNEALMNQTRPTDGVGEAIFDFKFSAVLDVDVIYYKQTPDTLNPTIINVDTMFGHQVVKVERIRQKSKENNYYSTVTVK